ncbi:MAG: hypothetical protein MI919_12915 [Holophagales bacterium]|nr:hypothetical protein [Holophagales bacterium]
MLFDPRTGTRRILVTLRRSLYGPGLSASPDASDILVSLREPMQSELRLIEGFR